MTPATKHTPWRAHENEVLGDGEIVIADVSVDIHTSLSQAKRHARLIAAAPELLAALKEMLDEFGDLPKNATASERATISDALAAIDKAETST